MHAIRCSESGSAPLPVKAFVAAVFCRAVLDVIQRVGFSEKERSSTSHGFKCGISYWVGIPVTALLLYGPFKMTCFVAKRILGMG